MMIDNHPILSQVHQLLGMISDLHYRNIVVLSGMITGRNYYI